MAAADIQSLTSNPFVKLVAVADVDLSRTKQIREAHPDVRVYQDWRQLLEKEQGNIDSVNVSTPDHLHGPIAHAAMQLGKHCYCQKPLAHNLHETRVLTELAREKRLVTQMGIQIHSYKVYRQAAAIVQSGVIGKVKEVHTWSSKKWGDLGRPPERNDPVPESLNWDLWLGPAPARPFHATYFPGPRWYRWWDFANGTMSDLGSHDNDVPFTVLDLWRTDAAGGRALAPVSVEAVSPNVPVAHPELAPATLRATFLFAATGRQPALTLVWHQGDSRPPGWTPAWGRRSCVFMGDKGMLLGDGKLLPEEKFKDFRPPAPTLAPGARITVKDAGASGWITVQGEGKVGVHDVATPTLIRFGQMTADELFISATAAADGYEVVNTGPGPLVSLRYFGPDVHADLPKHGRKK